MNITTIPVGALGTNCYLVWNEVTKQGFVVDPGDHFERILHEIKRNSVKVEAVLLTHAHFDHIMAVPELLEFTGAKLYVGKAEDAVLQNPEVNLTHIHAPRLVPDVWVKDGEKHTIAGAEVLCIHTPGHTPGSFCYLMDSTLFSGDTLFYGSCGRCDFPGGSVAEMYASLKRLAALDGEMRVLPGHDVETTLERERGLNPYMREAMQR